MTATTLAAPGLEQRVVTTARAELAPGNQTEIVFVASGEGVLRVDGEEHAVETDTGMYVGPGEEAVLEARNGALELVVVRTPRADLRSPRVVRYTERESEDAGIGRWFRLLVTTSETTQFVGLIPPGRAKMHNHPYDELAWLVEGEGQLHWHEGETELLARGSRIFFPRLVFHSVENLGGAPMRIMGVFRPAGSPADRVAVLDY
ncbi:MAG TPA: cupin domain-containing protein [Gaiellaceae bacterium]|jgi:mannose-6-phosphate isomerase-like protein (cupin superfamily)|nr:cupin domain-containing protein [Gaiellaceae bacterium]